MLATHIILSSVLFPISGDHIFPHHAQRKPILDRKILNIYSTLQSEVEWNVLQQIYSEINANCQKSINFLKFFLGIQRIPQHLFFPNIFYELGVHAKFQNHMTVYKWLPLKESIQMYCEWSVLWWMYLV